MYMGALFWLMNRMDRCVRSTSLRVGETTTPPSPWVASAIDNRLHPGAIRAHVVSGSPVLPEVSRSPTTHLDRRQGPVRFVANSRSR